MELPLSTNSVPRAFFPRVAIGCRLLLKIDLNYGGELIGGYMIWFARFAVNRRYGIWHRIFIQICGYGTLVTSYGTVPNTQLARLRTVQESVLCKTYIGLRCTNMWNQRTHLILSNYSCREVSWASNRRSPQWAVLWLDSFGCWTIESLPRYCSCGPACNNAELQPLQKYKAKIPKAAENIRLAAGRQHEKFRLRGLKVEDGDKLLSPCNSLVVTITALRHSRTSHV